MAFEFGSSYVWNPVTLSWERAVQAILETGVTWTPTPALKVAQGAAGAVPWTTVESLAGTLRSSPFSLTSAGAAIGTVVAAVPMRRIKVYAVKLAATSALSVNFRDGSAAPLEGGAPLPANGSFVECVTPPAFLFGTSAGNALDLAIIGAGTAAGRVSYWDDDAR